MDDVADSGDSTPGRRLADAGALRRSRAVHACLDRVGELGYREATVADVIAAAAISREEFYELFCGMSDCFRQALRSWDDGLMDRLAAAEHRAPDAISAVQAGIAVLLRYIADDVHAARSRLLEWSHADATDVLDAHDRRQELAAHIAARTATDPLAARYFLAGLEGIAQEAALYGRAADLPNLREELTDLAWRTLGLRRE